MVTWLSHSLRLCPVQEKGLDSNAPNEAAVDDGPKQPPWRPTALGHFLHLTLHPHNGNYSFEASD
jgi:hypothetical protein